MLQTTRKLHKNRKGQALVEYGILVGAIALVCLAATAILGHKANDLIAITAAVLPGAHSEDNGPIVSGQLVQTTPTGGEDGNAHVLSATPGSIGANLGIGDLDDLIVEPSAP